MKRALTGIAAASMVLGAFAPSTFAATGANGWKYTVATQLPIVVNGQVLSNPFELVANDSGNQTAYFPVYYFNQALNSIGYTATWDGSTHTWAITAPDVDATKISIPGGVGTGNTTITVNGTVVKKINTYAAKDPAGGPSAGYTTYFPAFYINEVFSSLGAKVSFSGQTGLSITKQQPQNTSYTLSNLTASGGTSGDGSVSNPALSLNGQAITLSTTLTDANGNPVPNTAVTFNVSNYGNYPSTLPTVKNASGTVVSGTQQTNAEQYTVYTDSNGVAKVTISGPSGSTIAYQVVATAPYLGSNSSAVSTQPAYVEFVVNNQAGIAPYAPDNSAPYNAAMGTPVPITVVLPPNASGQPQANVAVTLSVAYQSGGNGTNHASFVSSSGAVLGQQIQVVTNSSGVAQAYLSDTYGEEVKVTVSGLPVGVNQPNATYISFAQAGIAAKIANFNVSSNNPNIGDNVTVSGQLQDAAGNPVPNGQVIVTSPNVTASGGTGHLKYVNSDGTTTTFPMVSTSSVTAGTPATSAYGDVVTADSNGNFSFTVTDSRVETVNFYIYPVANGQIQSGTALNTANANQNTLNFGTSTNLAYLSIGAFDSYVASNSDTSLTGLTAQANAGGTAISTIGLDNGNNPQIADVYVEPQNSAGYHTGGALDNTALTYTLTVDNGGLIYSINGTRLSDHGLSPAAAVSLSYTPATATQPAKFSVNGVDWNLLTGAAHTSDFEVGVINANTGATKLTVQSGNVSSTASITFNGGTPDLVANFSPPYVTVSAGQSQKVTFQVQDANGNPVPNVATTILTDKDPSDPLWITQVNGVTLQETLNMGTDSNISYATEPTPIPLGTVPSALNYSVSVPGVVSWTKGSPNITVYSDSNGNVSLTLQAGGVNYPSAGSGSTPGNPNNVAAVPTSSGHVGFYSDENGDPGTIPLFIGVNPPTDGTTTNGSSFTAQGIFAWTGTGVVAAPDAASMSVTDNLSGTADTLDGAAGAVQAGATVKVYSDAALTTLVGSATAGANGSFSIPVGDNSSGTFTYYVTQTVGGVQSAATQVTYTAAQ